MTQTPTKPFANVPKSTGDLSHVDMSYLRDAAQPGSRGSQADTSRPEKVDATVLEEIVQSKTRTRNVVRAYTRLSEEQALALSAYGVVTDQEQSAVIRHAITRFLDSPEFAARIREGGWT